MIQLAAIATNQNHLATPVIDAHWHELAALTICGFLAKFVLPMIKASFMNISFGTELAHCLSTLQKLLVDGSEVI